MVAIQDSKGCQVWKNYTIYQPPGDIFVTLLYYSTNTPLDIKINISTVNVKCFGENSGSAFIDTGSSLNLISVSFYI